MTELCITCRYWVATNGPLCEACADITDHPHESDQTRYASECNLCETDGHLHLFYCPNNPRRDNTDCSVTP